MLTRKEAEKYRVAESRLQQVLVSLESKENQICKVKEELEHKEAERAELANKIHLMAVKEREMVEEQDIHDKQILDTVTDLLLDLVENRGPDAKAIKQIPDYAKFGAVLERLEGKIAALGINSQVESIDQKSEALADAQDIADMGRSIIKISDILGRTQKLPSSLMMLRDSLDTKRQAYEAKVIASERKSAFLLNSVHNSPAPSFRPAIASLRSPNIYKKELEESEQHVESLTEELKYIFLISTLKAKMGLDALRSIPVLSRNKSLQEEGGSKGGTTAWTTSDTMTLLVTQAIIIESQLV